MDMPADVVESSIQIMTSKPKLELQTPKTAAFQESTLSPFPSELSALSSSARSPYPGYGDFLKFEDGLKTPITPPSAYMDFLKVKPVGERGTGLPTPTSMPSSTVSTTPPIIISSEASSSIASNDTPCTCTCAVHKTPPATLKQLPIIVRSGSSTSHKRLSPTLETDRTKSSEMVSRPLSSQSQRRSREGHLEIKASQASSRNSHIREVISQTVVYTPRMSPAPKGKRRKLDSESSTSHDEYQSQTEESSC